MSSRPWERQGQDGPGHWPVSLAHLVSSRPEESVSRHRVKVTQKGRPTYLWSSLTHVHIHVHYSYMCTLTLKYTHTHITHTHTHTLHVRT